MGATILPVPRPTKSSLGRAVLGTRSRSIARSRWSTSEVLRVRVRVGVRSTSEVLGVRDANPSPNPNPNPIPNPNPNPRPHQALPPAQAYAAQRAIEGWQYGSGLDYEPEPASPLLEAELATAKRAAAAARAYAEAAR